MSSAMRRVQDADSAPGSNRNGFARGIVDLASARPDRNHVLFVLERQSIRVREFGECGAVERAVRAGKVEQTHASGAAGIVIGRDGAQYTRWTAARSRRAPHRRRAGLRHPRAARRPVQLTFRCPGIPRTSGLRARNPPIAWRVARVIADPAKRHLIQQSAR